MDWEPNFGQWGKSALEILNSNSFKHINNSSVKTIIHFLPFTHGWCPELGGLNHSLNAPEKDPALYIFAEEDGKPNVVNNLFLLLASKV